MTLNAIVIACVFFGNVKSYILCLTHSVVFGVIDALHSHVRSPLVGKSWTCKSKPKSRAFTNTIPEEIFTISLLLPVTGFLIRWTDIMP